MHRVFGVSLSALWGVLGAMNYVSPHDNLKLYRICWAFFVALTSLWAT